MDELITIKKSNIIKLLLICFIFSFIIGFYLSYNYFLPDTNLDHRLNRIEKIIQYKRFEYNVGTSSSIGINDEMTLSDIRMLYDSRKIYIRPYANMALGYVCDGTNEEIFNFMLK